MKSKQMMNLKEIVFFCLNSRITELQDPDFESQKCCQWIENTAEALLESKERKHGEVKAGQQKLISL